MPELVEERTWSVGACDPRVVMIMDLLDLDQNQRPQLNARIRRIHNASSIGDDADHHTPREGTRLKPSKVDRWLREDQDE